MQLKKYVAPSLKEAIDKMKLEMGEEAIVLSTRVLPRGNESDSSSLFEVVAGIDTEQTRKVEFKKQGNIVENKSKPEYDYDKALDSLRQKIYQKQQNIQSPESKILKTDSPQKAAGKQVFVLENLRQTLLDKELQPSIVNKIIDQISRIHRF